MNRILAGIMVVCWTGVTGAVGPRGEVRAALADAQRLPPEAASVTRYMTLYAAPKDARDELYAATSFWVNSLSREGVITRPRWVTDTLIAVEIDRYGWQHDTWETLAKLDPYFHAEVEIEQTIEQPYGYYRIPGDESSWVTTETKQIKKKVKQRAHAPWVPDAARLGTMVGSEVPIVRADWWCGHVAAQENRGGAGYYDWLGFKSRADIEKVTGLDRKEATKVRRELAAILADSGVARFNRQVFRYGSIAGAYWESRDVAEKSTGERNAVRNLDGDFKHDAEEIYATLPNGLFAYGASDADGSLQDVVPQAVALDHKSTSNDRNIHVGFSCVRCHTEGLRPIDDYARRVYRGPVKLVSPDRDTLLRLEQLYLSPLKRWIDRDVEDFAYAVEQVNGLTVEENAKVVAVVWETYHDTPRTPVDAARELGVTEEEFLAAVRNYVTATVADPVLAGFLTEPPVPVRVEHWEEVFPLVMGVIDDQQ